MIDHGFGVRLGPISGIGSFTLLEWRNDPMVYRWCRQFEPLEVWNHSKWLDGLSCRQDVRMYGIFDGETPVGVCGLTSIDLINRHAEFSLYIGPEFMGHGLGERALKTLCAHGFRALNLHHIFGETFEGNRAQEMFKRVGFIFDGPRRKFYFRDGKYIDAFLYSILADEFEAKWQNSHSS